MRWARINEIETAYVASGVGNTNVLFLHGWAASSRMWLRPMWALRREHRMWAVDLPGFGRSGVPDVDWYSVTNYTDHVRAFCEQMGIERLHAVVGHSMGGRVALDLARRYPSLAGRLVLVSPSVTGRLGFNLDMFMTAGIGNVLGTLSRHVWPIATAGAMSTYWAPRFLGSEGVKRTAQDLQNASWQASIGSLRALTEQNYAEYLGMIEQPALVICGKQDYTIPPRDSELAAEGLPQARLVMLERVHHWPTDEASPVFMDLLTEFLNGHKSMERL